MVEFGQIKGASKQISKIKNTDGSITTLTSYSRKIHNGGSDRIVVNTDLMDTCSFGLFSKLKHTNTAFTNDGTINDIVETTGQTEWDDKQKKLNDVISNSTSTNKMGASYLMCVMDNNTPYFNGTEQNGNDSSMPWFLAGTGAEEFYDTSRFLIKPDDGTITNPNITTSWYYNQDPEPFSYNPNWKSVGNPTIINLINDKNEILDEKSSFLNQYPAIKDRITYIKENINDKLTAEFKRKSLYYFTWFHSDKTNNHAYFIDNNSADKDYLTKFYQMALEMETDGSNPTIQRISEALALEWMCKCVKAGDLVNDTEPDVVHYYVDVTNDILSIEWFNKYFNANGYSPKIQIYAETDLSPIPKDSNGAMLDDKFNRFLLEYPDRILERNYNDFIVSMSISEISSLTNEITDKPKYINFYARCGGDEVRNVVCFSLNLSDNTIKNEQCPEYNSYIDDITIGKRPINDDNNDNDDDNGKKPPPKNDDAENPATPDYDGNSILTKTYTLTPLLADALGEFLWQSNWLSNLDLVNSNPIENIVGCKIFPLDLQTGKVEKITIGNVETTVSANVMDTTKCKIKKGFINVPKFYNNFLDYEPYTTAIIYIPFIGFNDIDCSILYKGTIELEYIFDWVTGTIVVNVVNNNYVLKSYSGNCGVEVPLTSNNRGSREMSIAMGFINTALNPSVGGVVNSLGSVVSTPFNTTKSGNPSPSCSLYMQYNPFVIMSRSVDNSGNNYRHDVGRPCTGSYYIRDLSGYTEVESCELKAPFTKEELDMAMDIMRSGFYV